MNYPDLKMVVCHFCESNVFIPVNSSSTDELLCPKCKHPLKYPQRFEIPDKVAIVSGKGCLQKIAVSTKQSAAEIYLHGAQVTSFQKNGEPPLLFLSAKSQFAPRKAIRGGVPICFPWFGTRTGDVAHGFARITEWELVKTSASLDGAVTLHFCLPEMTRRDDWKALHTELIVTVSDILTLELVAKNDSSAAMDFENCLHTYFQISDIGAVSINGLQGAPFNDNAAGGNGAHKVETDSTLRIMKETNRIYSDNTATVEIRDENIKRVIRVEKSGSQSTVVWNPWTTQLMSDFDPAEHGNMICVESGNVGRNKVFLPPGKASTLRVELSSVPW
jgi:D-hexose-6-phosphate mutarotase